MKRAIFILLLILLLLSNNAFAKDYFLRDYRNNKLLVMEEDAVSFKELMEFDRFSKIYLCVRTNEPNKFLLLTDSNGRYLRELNIVDVTSGLIEKTIKLGSEPFKWSLSEDRNHFFASYRSLDSGSYEILHFDIKERQEEVLNKFTEYLQTSKRLWMVKK